MKKILFLLLVTISSYGQTLQNPTFGNTTTNTLKIKTPATVTSVNFLPAFDADGITINKIDPVLLPLSTATINAINTADANNVKNSGNFTVNRIPYTVSAKNLTDSSRLLWNNSSSTLNVNGNIPILSLKENLNNRTIEITNAVNGSNDLVIRQSGGKKRLTLEGEDISGNGEAKLGIGNFSGTIPTESQVYVYGGDNGANIDARGSATVDEANIDLESSDWETDPKGLGFSYFGPLRVGLPTIFGYEKTNLGQIRFGGNDTALITSINPSKVTPIRFGINSAEIGKVDDKGFSYQSDFSAANSSNPRWLVDKAYADGLVVGLLDDRGSYNASSNLFPITGGSGTSGSILKGDIWYVSASGTLGGKAVAIGDSFRALADSPGQTAGNWSLLSSNLSYVPANDANVIHTTGNENKSGTLSFNNSTGVNTNAIILSNSSATNSSSALVATNTSASGSGAIFSNSASSFGTAVAVINSSSSGSALSITNTVNGTGIISNNISTAGEAIVANTSASGNGLNFVGKNNGVATYSVNKLGNVTGNSFIKSGGLATEYLKADGSVSTLTNPVTGTGTTGMLPIFTSTSSLGNSSLREGTFLEVLAKPFRYINDIGGAVGFHGDEFAALGSGSKMNLVTYVYGPTNSHKTVIDGTVKNITNSAGFEVIGISTATSFVKTGGTSSQTLQADGSVLVLRDRVITSSASTITLPTTARVMYYIYSGSGSVTWNLPNLASSSDIRFVIINKSATGTITLPSGTNQIWDSGTLQSSTSCVPGTSMEIYNDSVNFIIL